jgi:hypothetical protein
MRYKKLGCMVGIPIVTPTATGSKTSMQYSLQDFNPPAVKGWSQDCAVTCLTCGEVIHMKVKSTLARVVENILVWGIPVIALVVTWILNGDYPDIQLLFCGSAIVPPIISLLVFVGPMKYFFQLGMPVRTIKVRLGSKEQHCFFNEENKSV